MQRRVIRNFEQYSYGFTFILKTDFCSFSLTYLMNLPLIVPQLTHNKDSFNISVNSVRNCLRCNILNFSLMVLKKQSSITQIIVII